MIKQVLKSFNSQEAPKLLNILLKKLMEESKFKMPGLIGKYLVLMSQMSTMLHGFQIKMLMALLDKNVQPNQLSMFTKTGLKLDLSKR